MYSPVWRAGIAPTDVTQNRDDCIIVPPAEVTLNGDTKCNLIGTSFSAFRDQAVEAWPHLFCPKSQRSAAVS